MGAFFQQVWTILVTLCNPQNLADPDKFKVALNQPGVFWAALVAVNLIVFTETGLLIGFLLPGDSLLVVLGIVARLSEWNVPILLVTLSIAAIVGDTVGYNIGRKAGPALFKRPNSRFFKQEYLKMATDFFDYHGGKAIIFARFVPIVRTFVPVVAGAAQMPYRRFLFFNVIGGIGWIVSMVLLGYYLIPIVEPLLQKVFGDKFMVAKNIDKVVIVVIAVSVAPIAWKALQGWRKSRRAPAATSAATNSPS
jgi:membrane-associated protein